tara:strand:- start:35 stop:433 length:399 start_codon:yes stop_codon:yes gene_type:complete
MQIRKITEKDWDTMSSWWKDWGWEKIPAKDFLPNNGTGGLLVEVDKKPVASIFMYTTNSMVVWLGWPLSDKNYKENREEALNLLIKGCEYVCKSQGYKYLMFLGDNMNFINKLKKLGFTNHDKNFHLVNKQI